MKKLLAMLTCVLLLAACGGGGGSGGGNQSQVVPINTKVSKELGAITISLQQNPIGSSAKMVGLQTLPTPTNIRFLITNAATGFLATQDVEVLNTTSVTIPVPVASGYTVEAVSYLLGSRFNNLLKYNMTNNIDVSPNANTSVNITLQPIVISSITTPSSIVAGDAFAVSFNIPSLFESSIVQFSTSQFTALPLPIGTNWPYTGILKYSSDGYFNFNAPTATVPGTLYFQCLATINSKFKTTTDGNGSWIFIYPNINNGDEQISIPLTIPNGGISLGVVY